MKKLYGITVALITPMTEDQEVDLGALEKHVEMLIDKGVNCIYCCGTDSEMYHLTTDERKLIAETAVKAADGRVVVYVHVGAMRQYDTLELAKHAENIKADGIGVVTPSYFITNDRELENYYVKVAGSVGSDFPIYIYNIPQLAVNDIKPHVVEQIVERCDNVVGIKFNYPDINQTLDYTNVNGGNFSVLQGDDRVLPAWLALGCSGSVAGSANVFPEPLVASYKAYQDGDHDEALKQSKIAASYIDAMQNDGIAYFKAGMKIRGMDVGPVREPNLPLTDNEYNDLEERLKEISSEHNIDIKL